MSDGGRHIHLTLSCGCRPTVAFSVSAMGRPVWYCPVHEFDTAPQVAITCTTDHSTDTVGGSQAAGEGL